MKILSPDERRDLLLSVGTHKKTRRLTPIQVAHLIVRLQKTMSMEEIADELGLKETSTLQRFVSLLKLPEEIHPLIVFRGFPGYLSFTVGSLISRLGNSDDIRLLTKDACEKQRTKEEIRAIIQLHERGKKDIASAIKEIDEIKPQKIERFLFMGKLPEQNLSSESQKEQTIKLRVRLVKLLGATNVLSVAVNKNRFSFMVSSEAIENRGVTDKLRHDKVENFVAQLLETKE